MKNLARRLWNDEAGFVVTVELILVATILVIGLVSGLTILRDAVIAELGDTAGAVGAINQSYALGTAVYDGIASSGGTAFVDAGDGADVVTVTGVNLVETTGLAVTATDPATVSEIAP